MGQWLRTTLNLMDIFCEELPPAWMAELAINTLERAVGIPALAESRG